jgi:hypothetical protein
MGACTTRGALSSTFVCRKLCFIAGTGCCGSAFHRIVSDERVVRFCRPRRRVLAAAGPCWRAALSEEPPVSRRTLLRHGACALVTLVVAQVLSARVTLAAAAAAETTRASGSATEQQAAGAPLGKVTATGLRYYDFVEGDGTSPDWGDLCVVEFVLYSVPRPRAAPGSSAAPAIRLRPWYSTGGRGYLIKHGDGRTIAGIEEAIHTMREHGRRRVIVPPRLAYVHADLGPVPDRTWTRLRLAKKLEEGELLVFDLELRKVMKDPKDRGYYKDIIVRDGMQLPSLADNE